MLISVEIQRMLANTVDQQEGEEFGDIPDIFEISVSLLTLLVLIPLDWKFVELK